MQAGIRSLLHQEHVSPPGSQDITSHNRGGALWGRGKVSARRKAHSAWRQEVGDREYTIDSKQ